MQKRQIKITSLCQQLALRSDVNYTHGCVAVRGGKIVAMGYNHHHNRHFPTLHAEIHAILQLLKRGINPSEVQLYVARFNKEGAPSYSKPCAACETTIKESRIRRVFYMDRDATWTRSSIII